MKQLLSLTLVASGCAGWVTEQRATSAQGGTVVVVEQPNGVEIVSVDNVAYGKIDLPVFWGIHPDVPKSMQGKIREAFAFWNSYLQTGFFFDVGEIPFSRGSAEAGMLLMVYFEDKLNPRHPESAATASFRHSGGRITHAEIVVWKPGAENGGVTIAVAHELGHLLGLAHERGRSLMNFSLTGAALELSTTAANGIRARYLCETPFGPGPCG